jgi:hypothetical protein
MFVFPLLEYEVIELTTVNADLVSSHMLWLQQSAHATQEEFVTKYMRHEPTDLRNARNYLDHGFSCN